ncbi:MAG: biotin/lipoate A/B protein ligase family protein [bacterium]
MSYGLRVIDSGPQPASLNMATDEAILLGFIHGLSPPTLRFYSFSPPAMTLGRLQQPSEALLSRAFDLGLSVVRRPTGGRAVIHDGDLTYSIVASTKCPDLGGGVVDTYRKISEKLAAAFCNMGLDVSIEPPQRRCRYQRSASCFDAAVGHELIVGGEKIAGSAQVRQSGAFLQQGSITLIRPRYDFRQLFGKMSRAPRGLSSLVGRGLTYQEVMLAVRDSFRCSSRSDSLNEFETAKRDELVLKYVSVQWNEFWGNAGLSRAYECSQSQIRC